MSLVTLAKLFSRYNFNPIRNGIDKAVGMQVANEPEMSIDLTNHMQQNRYNKCQGIISIFAQRLTLRSSV